MKTARLVSVDVGGAPPTAQARTQTVTWGANYKIVGKCDPQKLSYPGAWKPARGTIADLAGHISAGHSWMPALLDGNRKRWQVNANRAELLALDIDGGLTIPEAQKHPVIAQQCCLMIESASSTPELNKFRLVFRLAEPLTSWQNIRLCNLYLAELVGHADPACKDSSRFFYGAPGRVPGLLQPEVTLPADFLERAKQWTSAKESALREQYERWQAERAKYQALDGDQLGLVEQALAFAPVRSPGCGNYSDCVVIAAALLNEFGAATAVSLLERFIPPHHASGDQWNPEKTVRSLERGNRPSRPATLGSLFWICQQNGFRFPQSKPNRKSWRAKQAAGQNPEPTLPTKAERRAWAIQQRITTFREQFWASLQQDFLLGRADIKYFGDCPQIDLNQSRTHLIQGWLGAGKTEVMLQAVKRLQETEPDRLVIWLANRNGLLHNTLTRAQRLGIKAWHYQSDVTGNRELIQANHGGLILMCAESFKSYATDRIDWGNTVLMVDEFRALRCNAQDLSSEFPQIQQALAEAHTVVAADAFLSDADRGVLKPYRGSDRIVYRQQSSKSPKLIKWVELLTKDGLTSFRHEGGYFTILDQMIAQGGRNAIAVDSRLLANIFADYLRGKGQTVLVASTQTVDSNRAVLPDPTAAIEQQNPDWFIYSPKIQAGADIQAKFDRGLLVATGVLSPIDMLQMLGRCRQCPEWLVSAPRFSAGADDSAPFKQFSPKQVSYWAERAGAAFEGMEFEIDAHTQRWAQWQTATHEIEQAYNSEYLLCLLQHFFESVEAVEVEGGRAEDFKQATLEVKNSEVASCLGADLLNGQRLIQQQKAPSTDSEYWDLELAKWHGEFPQIVERLQQGSIKGFKLTSDLQSHLDIGRLFRSRRVDKLKAYRLAGREGIEAELERRIKSRRFVSPQSRTWKQYRAVCLFRSLDLERLANCTDEAILNETGYTAESPIAAELWRLFQASRKLKALFPEVEGQGDLWRVVCRTMSGFGFQSVGKSVRVPSDIPVPNGKNRDGSQRFSYSKPVHMSAWRPHADSGSKLFQANYDAIIEAIDGHLDREQEHWDDFYFRQEQKRREAEAMAA